MITKRLLSSLYQRVHAILPPIPDRITLSAWSQFSAKELCSLAVNSVQASMHSTHSSTCSEP